MVSENSESNIAREPGEHKVTFTVTLACAVQAGSTETQKQIFHNNYLVLVRDLTCTVIDVAFPKMS